jgi:hypothetical protein
MHKLLEILRKWRKGFPSATTSDGMGSHDDSCDDPEQEISTAGVVSQELREEESQEEEESHEDAERQEEYRKEENQQFEREGELLDEDEEVRIADAVLELQLIEAEKIVSSSEVYRRGRYPYVQACVKRYGDPEYLGLEIGFEFYSLVVLPFHDTDENTIQLTAGAGMYCVHVSPIVLGLPPKHGTCREAGRFRSAADAHWEARAKVSGDHGIFEARLVEDDEAEAGLTLEVMMPQRWRFVIRVARYWSNYVSLLVRSEKLVEVELPFNALRGEGEWK